MSILQQLIEWDKELLLFLNSIHTPFGDKFMYGAQNETYIED